MEHLVWCKSHSLITLLERLSLKPEGVLIFHTTLFYKPSSQVIGVPAPRESTALVTPVDKGLFLNASVVIHQVTLIVILQ